MFRDQNGIGFLHGKAFCFERILAFPPAVIKIIEVPPGFESCRAIIRPAAQPASTPV
jgi:hypothetical protein